MKFLKLNQGVREDIKYWYQIFQKVDNKLDCFHKHNYTKFCDNKIEISI